jgi:hypothetical protein
MNNALKHAFVEKGGLLLTSRLGQPSAIQQDKFKNALRTYATWLVRAARRKMAESGSENTPQNALKKEAELT